jgi:hypothetical protein
MPDSDGDLMGFERHETERVLEKEGLQTKQQLAAAMAAGMLAKDILRSPSIFTDFAQDVRKAGLVGESLNALVLFVTIISRLLDKPLSALVKGANATGKDFFVKCILKFLPLDRFQEISSMSPRLLTFIDSSSLFHRVLYFHDVDGCGRSGHPARMLLSDGTAHHLYTQPSKWSMSGKTAVDHVTSGSVACISTTAEDWLGINDESLHFSLWLDESSPQTKAIAKAYVAKTSETLDPIRRLGWIFLQYELEKRTGMPIEMPDWFPALVDLIPTSDVRIRRYWPSFVEARGTVCLIRSFQWNDDQLKARGGLKVSFSDFAITNLIFDDVIVNSLTRNAKDEDVKTAEMVKRVATAKSLDNGVAAADLVGEPGVTSIDKAYRLLQSADRAGTVVRLNASLKNNQKLYAVAPEIGFLGSPERAYNLIGLGEPVDFIHPITGAPVRYSPRKK